MLRSFRVENHKSILREAELLLMPAYDKARRAVPVAAIFGANAAGKSNLLDALRWMQDAVHNSFGSWEPKRGVPRRPFRLDPEASGEPSQYTVELVLDEVRHLYGFVVDDERVREEWLYVYPHNRKRIVFERNGDDWVFGSTVSRARIDVLRDLTSPASLFLSVAARLELPDVQPVHAWFQKSLRYADQNVGLHSVIEYLLKSEDHRFELVGLVRAADLGLRDVQVDRSIADSTRRMYEEIARSAVEEEQSARKTRDVAERALVKLVSSERSDAGSEKSRHRDTIEIAVHQIDNALRRRFDAEAALHELMVAEPYQLRFVHGDGQVGLKADEQSYGTLAWLSLLVPALSVLREGGVLCVDEIDSSLHPRLTSRLIELFKSAETNPKGGQLIFTTHDATLLGTSFGQDILARDEVWFVEKAQDGGTRLFPLSDFKPRKEENTERRYLGGSYGAVPVVSEYEFRRAVADHEEAA